MIPINKGTCACCSKPAKWMEPRFLYLVCDEHKHIKPINIPKIK